MADAALFIGWNRALPGCEAKAGAFFKESMGLYATFQKEGKIENFEPVILTAHGGDLNGFVIVRGEQKKLDELRHDERFMDMILKSTMLIGNIGVTGAYINKGLEQVMGRYAAISQKL